MSFAALAEQGKAVAAQYGYPPTRKPYARQQAVTGAHSNFEMYREKREQIIAHLRRNKRITRVEIMEMTGLSSQATRSTLETLRLKKIAKFCGHGPNGWWVPI